jgi:uncharacterized membrane protein
MTPKFVNWIGSGIVLAILVVVNAAALYNILSGKTDVRAEIITVIVSGAAILIAVALKLLIRREPDKPRRR